MIIASQLITSCKNKAGRGICMTSEQKYINQLRSDKFVGITPAQPKPPKAGEFSEANFNIPLGIRAHWK